MPRYDRHLLAQAQLAIEITRAGETVRAGGDVIGRQAWTLVRLEALYELAYLRVFAAWETVLEGVFFRSLCGYASRAGQETLVTGTHYPTLDAAERAVLAWEGAAFLLWHNPGRAIRRCQHFIRSGAPNFPAIQEATVNSHRTRLEYLASVRHRIVHEQKDARQKFNDATTALTGRTYAAARPGKFLRDWDRSTIPPRRWLDITINELVNLTGQMV
jgi:hypothetical protein